MSDAEVYEHFFDHNPLNFDKEALARLAQEHKVVPTWANRKWRTEQRGWRGLQVVPADKENELTKAVLDCCDQLSDLDIEYNSVDGEIRHGDLILCVQDVKLKERNDRRRTYRADKKLRSLKKGQSDILEEVAKRGGGTFTPAEPTLTVERGPLSKVVTTESLGNRRGGAGKK